MRALPHFAALALAACTGRALVEPVPDARADANDDTSADAFSDAIADASPDGPVLPPPDPCTETALDDVHRFPRCGLGAGVFGRWIVDDNGLPAYDYLAAQELDPRASYPNSRNLDLRDHWHQLGNDRVIATAHNGGYVELVGAERGFTVYNRFAPDQSNYAGGFGYVGESTETWSSAYDFRPDDAVTRRVFGIGYVEYVTTHDRLRVTHHVYAPSGDRSLLIDDVTLENLADAPRTIRHYEYWDANRHQLTFQALRSGSFGRQGDVARDALNRDFVQRASWDPKTRTARVSMRYTGSEPRPAPEVPAARDLYPHDVFLAALVGDVNEIYTDQRAFFGAGGPRRPDAIATPRAGEVLGDTSGEGQPACLVARSDVTLAPNTPRHLRYAFGYVANGDPVDLPITWRDESAAPFAESTATWRQRLGYFASETDPAVHREFTWRSYYLQSASLAPDFFGTHTIAQGGEYLFGNGLDGAPRDQALFAMPLVYVRPDLAKQLLAFIMAMTRASDGSIAYSYHGHGVLEDALIHAHPSDLDLFLLLGASEYLAATGDRAFLDEHVPFYPRDGSLPPGVASDTVLDHLRLAYRHFDTFVGTGSHGLVRVLDGDWNDGIAFVTGIESRAFNAEFGESHPNTAMAAAVLPVAADVLAPSDPTLATDMRTRAASLLTALRAERGPRWYPRAWLRDRNNAPVLIGGDDGPLWLETQPWALLANASTASERAALEREIDARVDGPSPIGAMIQEPTVGNEANAQVWPAITGLLTWAYTRDRPDLAWRSVLRNSYFSHAETYPTIWNSIWSGPDGVQGVRSAQAGYAWTSVQTPMQDFPVMNANPDAMGLLGVIRVAGIEPTRDGLRVVPVVPGDRFVLDTMLLRLERAPGRYSGEYRAIADGSIALYFVPGARATNIHARVRGVDISIDASTEEIRVPLSFTRGERVAFELTYE